ncbi:MAG TPA: proline/betaine ABC transporter permease ProW, partial [Pantoea sp.]|nr:proline/betaine ABC transporter permease ProW [Pantoea sp.]
MSEQNSNPWEDTSAASQTDAAAQASSDPWAGAGDAAMQHAAPASQGADA